MTTGEHPLPIGDNTTVRLGLVITLLGVAATAGAAHWRVGAGEAQAEKTATAVAKLQEQAAERDRETALNVQSLKIGMEGVQSSLRNIERQLERMNGTRPARGER